MHKQLFWWLVLMVCLMANAEAKKQCQSYLDKLRNIQAQQKIGHTNKQARALAKKEQKARDTWWQCQQGKLTKQGKLAKKTKQKKQTHASRQQSKADLTSKHLHASKPLVVDQNSINYNKPVVIKGKYQGVKQQAWLDYYQQPEQCKKPSSTKVFAKCLQNRDQQQINFEQGYQEK